MKSENSYQSAINKRSEQTAAQPDHSESSCKKRVILFGTNLKKVFSVAITSILLLSGCGAKEAEEVVPETAKPVPVFLAKERPFTEKIEISGTLKAKSRSVIAAETSGVVREIYVEEGNEVQIGQSVVLFFQSTNLAQADMESAQTSLQNAEQALELVKRQAQKNEESAQIGIRQAEENLKNSKKTDSSTGTSISAQISATESSVELAKITLQNAEKNKRDTEENLVQREKDLLENRQNTIGNTFATYRNVLRNIDEFMGVNPETKKKNDAFEMYLGFKEPQTKIDATNSFRTLWSEFFALEEKYIQDEDSVSINDIVSLSECIRETLQLVDLMLKKSITSGNFTQSELTSLQATTSAGRSTIEGSISALTAITQQIDAFYISKPQQLESVKIGIDQAKQQLTQAEKTLEQIKSSGDVSKIGTGNQISVAENGLESAKNQLEIVKKQNEISIEQASSARDNARNALNKTQLQASKLSVDSPVRGIVTEKMVEVGDTVSLGTPLLAVSQIESLVLKGDIDARFLPQIHEGDSAIISADAFGEKTGTISKIYPSADIETRRIPLEITLENPEKTIPANIFASARISLKEEQILLIPQNALISQDPPAVFVVGEGEQGDKTALMIERRNIVLGREQDGFVEVLEGLFSGEIIVPQPILGLKERDVVQPSNLEKSGNKEQKSENTNQEAENFPLTRGAGGVDENKNSEQKAENKPTENDTKNGESPKESEALFDDNDNKIQDTPTVQARYNS